MPTKTWVQKYNMRRPNSSIGCRSLTLQVNLTYSLKKCFALNVRKAIKYNGEEWKNEEAKTHKRTNFVCSEAG